MNLKLYILILLNILYLYSFSQDVTLNVNDSGTIYLNFINENYLKKIDSCIHDNLVGYKLKQDSLFVYLSDNGLIKIKVFDIDYNKFINKKDKSFILFNNEYFNYNDSLKLTHKTDSEIISFYKGNKFLWNYKLKLNGNFYDIIPLECSPDKTKLLIRQKYSPERWLSLSNSSVSIILLDINSGTVLKEFENACFASFSSTGNFVKIILNNSYCYLCEGPNIIGYYNCVSKKMFWDYKSKTSFWLHY